MSEAEPRPLPYDERVTINLEPGEALSVTVGNGEVVLFLTRGRAPERAGDDQPSTEGLRVVGGTDETVRERVNIVGRLGNDPRFAPLPNRGLRASFRVGEHLEDGSTVWHEVYATERFAHAIEEKELHRGDEVQVSGERQVDERHPRRRRDGTLEPQVRIYAYGVRLKRRAGQPPQEPQP